MRKTLLITVLATTTFAACTMRGDIDRDNKDTINAVKADKNAIQSELNADTSSNSPGASDKSSTQRDTNVTEKH